MERLLTRSPETLNTKGTNKLTPLHIATHYRHKHVVRYLVGLGANLDAQAKVREILWPAPKDEELWFLVLFGLSCDLMPINF